MCKKFKMIEREVNEMVYVVSVMKQNVTERIEGVTLYDTETGRRNRMSYTRLLSKIKSGTLEVENTEFRNGKLQLVGETTGKFGNSALGGWYMKQLGLRYTEYRYLSIVGVLGDNLEYVGIGTDGELKYAVATLREIAYTLGIKVSQLVFCNGKVERLNSKERCILIYNKSTGEYEVAGGSEKAKQLLEMKKQLGGIYSVDLDLDEDGKVRLSEVDFNGVGEYKLPAGIKSVSYVAGVNTLIAGEDTEEIEEFAFYDSDDIITFNGNNTVKVIKECAFLNSSVQHVKGIENTEYIGERAFQDSDLKGSLKVSAEVVDRFALASTPLKRVKFEGTKVIGYKALANCYNLEQVDLGEEVEVIDEKAMYGSGLKKLYVSSSCKEIRSKAFAGCNRLKIAIVPKCVRVAEDAFDRNCRLVRI